MVHSLGVSQSFFPPSGTQPILLWASCSTVLLSPYPSAEHVALNFPDFLRLVYRYRYLGAELIPQK